VEVNSMKTAWSKRRLNELFQEYNQKYCHGRLQGYTVSISNLRGTAVGFCDVRHRRIQIDVAAHEHDDHIGHTLLHEMVHAAVGRRPGLPHGYHFWEQMERILRQGAPMEISSSEMPGAPVCADAIPDRFPLCKKAVKRLERAQQKAMRKLPLEEAFDIDEDYMEERFEAAAAQGFTWDDARLTIGMECGLLDVAGKPKGKWATKLLSHGREAFHRMNRIRAMRKRARRYFRAPVQ
jgi:SprT-like family protein